MKKPLFTVTAHDCEWDYYRGSGKGGQKRNKTSSAVRCRHLPSGAIGQSEDGRSQLQNKKLAFRRMAESKKFQDWARIEAAKASGYLYDIEKKIERELEDKNITRVEVINEEGKWENDKN